MFSMSYRCAICETKVYRFDHYFCLRCYDLFKDDIHDKKEWTRFIINEEAKRRRREKSEKRRSISVVYLGDELDIDDEGSLVRGEGYHYG